MKMRKNILKFILSVAVCQAAGLLGAIFTFSSIENWYNNLNQPSFRPPNWLFGPAWAFLYTLMGISLYRIWIKGTDKKEIRDALKLFAVHLIFNSTWSIVFFGLRDIPLSLINIIVLLALIVLVMIKFYKIDKKASFILLPYLAWGIFRCLPELQYFSPEQINSKNYVFLIKLCPPEKQSVKYNDDR